MSNEAFSWSNEHIFIVLCRQGFALNFVFINFNTFSFKLVLQAVKTLAANAGGRGFEPHRGQNLFSQFTLFYRV